MVSQLETFVSYPVFIFSFSSFVPVFGMHGISVAGTCINIQNKTPELFGSLPAVESLSYYGRVHLELSDTLECDLSRIQTCLKNLTIQKNTPESCLKSPTDTKQGLKSGIVL